jgi:predicted Fe-Mo cluster-binding NifX family protein
MKIAFTSSGRTWDSIIDPRFGRTAFIVTYDEESQEFDVVDNSAAQNHAHGAGTATAQKIYEILPQVLITGNGPGETASKALIHAKMKIFINAHNLTLQQAYDQYKLGKLEKI